MSPSRLRPGRTIAFTVDGVAEACHRNFYNDSMDPEDLETYLPDIRELVRVRLPAPGTAAFSRLVAIRGRG